MIVNFFILVCFVASLAAVLIALVYVLSLVTGRRRYETKQEKSTREQYNGRIPRAGNHYLLAIALFLLIGLTGKAQVFVLGGAGISNKYFSAELQAGYRYQQTTVSLGYIALPERTQPALFNVRAGYVIAERVHVYGSYVKVMYSLDDKSRNSNTWQAGAQYLFSHYDRGSFYVGANYTGNKMLSAHIGMTFQLSKGID